MEKEVKDSEETFQQLSDRGAMNHVHIEMVEHEISENTLFGMKLFDIIKISREIKPLLVEKVKPNTAQKKVQNRLIKQ